MNNRLKILVVLGRHSDSLIGIANYNQQDEWLIRNAEAQQDIQQIVHAWQPDGLIYRYEAKIPSSIDLPRVELFNPNPKKGIYSVDIHHEHTGKMAAEFLINKGYRNLVFITGSMKARSILRYAGFQETIKAQGLQTCIFENCCEQGMFPSEELQEYTTRLGQWMSRQPRPLAVFTINDHHALHVLEACRQFDLQVPENVAVLSADNGAIQCAIAHPPLSSIQLPYKQLGFEAARLLNAQLHRKKIPVRHIRLDPIGVVERRSTELLAFTDEAVVKAVNYIREHRTKHIHIPDVVKSSGVSRTLLQRKFQQTLGRTPLEEIHRQKTSLASDLLRNTLLSIDEVAEKCGLSDQAQFTKLFRRKTGLTPSAYRKKTISRS